MSLSGKGSISCENSVKAGLQGTAIGMLNMIGIGSLLKSIPGFDAENNAEQALKDAQDALNNAQSTWSTAITDIKYQIIEDQINNLQSLIKAAASQQALIIETLSQKIDSNSLMISMLIILVIFLVLYDIV